MTSLSITGDQLWTRMERAVEKVRERLIKATQALEAANLPYAVVGGNAVRIWVSQVDEAAVRTTRDVDILVRRNDLDAIKATLEKIGFIFRHSAGVSMFLDGEGAKARDAVHLVFSGEMVREDDVEANPDVEPFEYADNFRTIPIETLVSMKLNSHRLKDRVHVLDMISVGLIDRTWLDKFAEPLRERLKSLLDDPGQ